MPRDGSNVYTQPFPNVVDGTTIESAVYNGFTNDVTLDLNTPRPIVAGGTGAGSADVALFNIGGEKAAQLVTNYDSHVWAPGSFRSAAGATSAPTANASAGVVYINEALANPPTNANVIIEARDLTTGAHYVRRKTAGSWGSWVQDIISQADSDARYVNITGDTMQSASGTTTLSQTDNPATSTSSISTTASNLSISNNAKRIDIIANANSGTNTGQLVLETDGTVNMAKQLGVGTASGTVGTSPVSRADANIFVYTGSGNNWAGIGADSSADMWLRAGNIGTNVVPQMMLSANGLDTTITKLSSPNGYFGSNIDTPLIATTGSTGIWPVNISGYNRSILYLVTDVASNIYAFFCQGSTANNVGSISGNTTSVSYVTSSDGRNKPQREAFSGLDIINNLNPVYHNWINEPEQWSYGLIAQEAYEVLPQIITKGDDDAAKKSGDEGFIAWGADYSKAVPVLIRAVQELVTQNTELRARIEALEAG